MDSRLHSGVCLCLILKPFEGLRHFQNQSTVSLVKPSLPSAHPSRQGLGVSMSSLPLRSEAGVCVCLCGCAPAPSQPLRGTFPPAPGEPLDLGPHPPIATTTASVRTRRLKNCECVVGGEWTCWRRDHVSDHRLDHEEGRDCVLSFHPQSKGAAWGMGGSKAADPEVLPGVSCSLPTDFSPSGDQRSLERPRGRRALL